VRDLERKRATNRVWRQKNAAHVKAEQAKWRAANAAKIRDYQLQFKFGITAAQYDEMLLNQGGRCAICLHTEPMGRGVFHVDHCHRTGKVRGLLCTTCNTGLGHFGDSVLNLKLAQRYLEEHARPS
jgi:hypothetical protein